MAARRLTAKERRELPARAFGIPSSRKYPVMVLGRNGEPKFSKSHAVDAKARAKEGLEKGWIDRRQYNQIVRKADAAIKDVDRARTKAKRNPAKKKVAKRKTTKRKSTKRKATKRKNPRKNPGYTVMLEHVDGRHKIGYGETAEEAESIASKQLGRPVKVDFDSGRLVGDYGGQLYFIEGPEITELQESILYIEAGSGSWDPEEEMNSRYAPLDSRGETDRKKWLDAVRGLYMKGFVLTRTGSLEEEKAWHADKDESWWRFDGLTDGEIEYIAGWKDRISNPKRKRKPAKKATRARRKNPSEADHERVGVKALRNSEEYWRGYMADKSKTNLLVDAYKFLVIAHEELKYAGDAEPRLEADHMLKAAHKELSKQLK